jgi:hypothetical protein
MVGRPSVQTFPFRAGRWYYLALTVDARTGVATLFINGSGVARIQWAYPFVPLLTDPTHPIALGDDPRYVYPTNPAPTNLDGVVGQVAIYEYALSSHQVAAHYSAGRNG